MAKAQVFKRRLRIRAERISRNANDAVKRAALVIDQLVVMGTPVDTGRARSNWVVSIGLPSFGVIAPYAPGNKLGIGEGANTAGALDQGRAVIARRKDPQTIYIVNNVHYIGSLNRGTSPQAGANFVEKAIHAALAAIRQTRLLK